MKFKTVAALDIGTHSIKMALVRNNSDTGVYEVLGLAEEPSLGVRKGAIVHPEEVARKIAGLKTRIEQMAQLKVNQVTVNIGGSHIFTLPSRGVVAISRADGLVSKEDVERVLQAAQALSLDANKEVLDIFPQQFIVDGTEGIKEAIGMRGVRLEVDVLAVCAFSPIGYIFKRSICPAKRTGSSSD